MSNWKAPRSCLSESLREYENSAVTTHTEGTVSTYETPRPNDSSTIAETWDPMSELDAILQSSNNNDFDPAVVFGCTPPSRSTNPISRDRNFTTTKTTSYLTRSFKTPCKDAWSFMSTPTCPTFH